MIKRVKPFAIIAVVLFFAQAAMQRISIFPSWSKNYSTKQMGVTDGLSPDHLLVALAGFRELVSGILWVKADSFFHDGNYDAILPIIRLATWLDPHNVDVYSVGMWHIGYNFTDTEHRSDRRYLPSALALGKEGAKFNPYQADPFFELGWTWFHKIDDDYSQAVKWMELAQEKKGMIFARRSMLSNAYLRDGQVYKALEHYRSLLKKAKKESDKGYGLAQIEKTIENNLDNLLLRMAKRGYFEKLSGEKAYETYSTYPRVNINFDAKVKVIEPRVLQFEGKWGLNATGTHLRVILRDLDYPNAGFARLNWDAQDTVEFDLPENLTYMQDSIYVKKGKFRHRVNLSHDPTVYPLDADKYLVEFYYNPRSAPHWIQDRLGWNGLGMKDPRFSNTNIRDGQRVIYATLQLDRDMILRWGEWEEKVPEIALRS